MVNPRILPIRSPLQDLMKCRMTELAEGYRIQSLYESHTLCLWAFIKNRHVETL